jgi:hypothetical protein
MIYAWIFWLTFWTAVAEYQLAVIAPPPPPPRPTCTVTNLAQWRTDHQPNGGRAA